MRPTRETVEGRAYLDLQNQARRDMRPTDELRALYALEGFLPGWLPRPRSRRWSSKAQCCSPRSVLAGRPETSTCTPGT